MAMTMGRHRLPELRRRLRPLPAEMHQSPGRDRLGPPAALPCPSRCCWSSACCWWASDASSARRRRPTRSRRSPRCCRCGSSSRSRWSSWSRWSPPRSPAVYSSGLALLALGVPLSRVGTNRDHTVIISAGAFYLLFISDSFLATFQAFLALVAVPMGNHGRHPAARLHPAAPTKLGRVDGAAARSRRPPGRWTALLSLVWPRWSASGWSPRAPEHRPRGRLPAHRTPPPMACRQTNMGVVIAMVLGAGCTPCSPRAEDRRRPPAATADPARGRTAVATGR